jgi:hypothetical protein
MGIHNAAQIRQLQTQLDQQTACHNKLLKIVQTRDEALDLLDKGVSTATTLLGAMIHQSHINIASHLSRFTGQSNRRLYRATHVIQ